MRMNNTFSPRRIAYAIRTVHEGGPCVPTRDLNLIRPGYVVFSDLDNIDEKRTQQLLNEVLQNIAGSRSRVAHTYTDARHVTIEVTNTGVIARDFDGNSDRQSFYCLNGSIIYSGHGHDGPVTPGDRDESRYIIESWA